MPEFSSATKDALRRKEEEDAKRKAERQYVADIARLLGADGLDASDFHVREVRRLLSGFKQTQDRFAANKATAGDQPRRRFNEALNRF